MIISVLQTALPVFAALGLGMVCRSRGFLKQSGVDALKWVVLNITLPFMLFNAFATAQYSFKALAVPAAVFLLCCVCLFCGLLAVKLFALGGNVAGFLSAGFEAGMLGYALFALLYPNHAPSEFALPDLGQTLFVFTVYKLLLSGKSGFKAVCRDMVTSPVLWAVAAGVLTGATGLYTALHRWGAGGILDNLTSFLSAPTGMIILLTVGYDLVLKEISWKQTAGLIVMRLVFAAVFYALLVLLNRTILNGALFEGAALLLAILPPPYVLPVFSKEPGERVQLSSALSAMTVITIILFAALSVLLNLQ